MKKNGNRPFLLGRKAKKLFIMMKLTILLLLIGLMQVSASIYSQTTKFNFRVEDKQIVDVLKEIEETSNFRFFYIREQVDVERKVSVNANNATVEEILNKLFKGQSLKYKILDDALILISPEGSSDLIRSVSEQQKTVSGKVTDVNGQPLPGVTVVVKGTNTGTVTDTDGMYSLSVVKEEAILVFSFVGLRTQEVSVKGKTTINISLVQETIGLEEVVAVGYGTQKKMNLTGSVVQVDAEELAKQTVTSAAQAIQGRAAGVQVVRNNGAPGSEAQIRIRGLGTFGNSSPLVLVDGVEANINQVSPQDIESINILKDASAGAIYGVRAANGVVIVTTKKGKTGKSRIAYNFSTGVSDAIRLPNAMNAHDFVRLQNEALVTANLAPFYTDAEMSAFDEGSGTDWIAAVLQTGVRQNHNLQFSGGTDKLRYSLMGDLLDETGVVINSWYKRYNVRLNLDTDVTNWLTIGLNAFGMHSKQHETPYEGYESPLIVHALQYTPTITPKEGGLEGTGGVSHTAPTNAEWKTWDPVVYSNLMKEGRNFYPKYSLVSSFFADFKLAKGLNFKTTWSINKYFANNKVFTASHTLYDELGKEGGGNIIHEVLPQNRYLSQTAYDNYQYTITNLLTYTKTLNDVHNFSALIGNSDQLTVNKWFSAAVYNFPNNDLQMLGLGSERQAVNESANHYAIRSYFGRVNYDYQGKYLVEFSVRRDASSKFSEKYRWGTFPSGSLGWRISDENFMDGTKNWLDDMKIRASYGVLGGQDFGTLNWNSDYLIRTDFDFSRQPQGLYESYATMNLTSAYPFNSTYTTGAAATTYANPEIKWEVAHITNLGVDMTLFDGIFQISAEYFSKRTKDLVLAVSLPATIGQGIAVGNTSGKYNANVGEMLNNGFEYVLHYFKNKGEFKFDIRYSGSHLHNEIVKLQPGVDHYFLDANYAMQHKVGEPYGAVSGFKILGIYQTQEEIDERLKTITERGTKKPGDYIYDDTNGDGVIDANDVIVQGSPVPTYIMGLTANASYKGFDFNIHLQGDFGSKQSTMVRGRFDFSYRYYLNNYDYLLERWRGPGTSDTQARVAMGSANNGSSNSNKNVIQNTSYAKIRHIELGYNIPKEVMQKLGLVDGIRIFCNAANLFTFTKYVGFEVERTGTYQRTDVTPQYRTISFGANVKF